jgi:hypothetical protein
MSGPYDALLARGGVRAFKLMLGTKAAPQERSIYFKAKSSQEIAVFLGAERRYPDNEQGDVLRERTRASFIATALCDEAGSLAFKSAEEAMALPNLVKLELCNSIVRESGRTDAELGKG